VLDDLFLDWWAGELALPERRRVEVHLLSCGECAARLQLAGAVADGVRTLVREGRVPTVLTPAVLDRLRREGRKIREYRVAGGGGVQCTVAPDDDVLVARLELPPGGATRQGATRVDLVSCIDDGEERRVTDVPLDPAASELILAPSIDFVRSLPACVFVYRLIEVRPEGERPLGAYDFHHTPWPGAAAP
jgi:hypothetical protein